MKLLRIICLVAGVCGLVVGCSGDPQKVATTHFQKGEAHLKAGRPQEAEVEFKAALQAAPRMGEAFFQLGEIYHQQENPAAFDAYIRASDLLPNDVAAHIRAANYLMAAQRFEDARTTALKAVKLDPRNVEALILVGNASAGLNDLERAITELQAAQKLDASDPRVYNNLGWFEALRGRSERAEAVFRSAIAAGPKSAAAHLALANYLIANGKREEGEKSLRTAISVEPAHVPSLRAMGWFLTMVNRPKEAEPFLLDAAKYDKRQDSKILLADYYVWSGRDADAVRVLEQLKATQESVTADARLASILYRTDRARARTLVASILKSQPFNPDAQLISAQLLFDDRKLTEALAATDALTQRYARLAQAHFLRGRVLTDLGRYGEAENAFRQVVSLNPRAVTAHLYLARLNLLQNDVAAARRAANEVLRLAPGNPAARLALAEADHASRDWPAANRQIADLLRTYSDWRPVQVEASRLAVAQSDWASARKALDRMEALEPGARDTLEGRLAVDVGQKDFKSAFARLDNWLAKNATDQRGLLIAGQVYLAAGDAVRAENAWKKLLSINPGSNDAYDALGRMYYSSGRLAAAEQQFATLSEKGADTQYGLVLAGVLADAQGKVGVAKERYQKVLALNPQSPVAANNLAWIYAQEGANLDVALGLAQTATRAAPDNPEFADTLGVIFLKKGQVSSAMPYLQAAVNKAPKNATIQLHLAQAFVASGKADEARAAAEKALAIDPSFPEAAEAKAIVQRRGKPASPNRVG
jgi:tetratricopeptide (TPR) repeat protein